MLKNKQIGKKEQALKFFNKTLLKNFKKDIRAIYLFGSLVRGQASKESDIDVLIFSKKPSSVASAAWDTSLKVYEKFGESIEALTYPSKKYENPDSYFIYQATNTGKRLYPV